MGVQGEFFEVATPALFAEPVASAPEVSESEVVEAVETEPVASEESITKEAPVAAVEESGKAVHTSRRTMKDLSIPKLYYSISEVSRLTALEPYVLRYWETEFDELKPQKNRAGNRIYSNRDIKFILRIKELLREKRYTIEGAKAILRNERLTDKTMEEPVPMKDPAQIPLPTDGKPQVPGAMLTLDEIRSMKSALVELKKAFARA